MCFGTRYKKTLSEQGLYRFSRPRETVLLWMVNTKVAYTQKAPHFPF
jgi:hypothetical protein